MTSSKLQRSRSRRLSRPVGIIVAAGVVAVAFVTLVPHAAAPLQSAARPLWQFGTAIAELFSGVQTVITSKETLQRRVDALERERALGARTVAQAELIQVENERLLELWNRRAHETTVLARVLVRPNTSPYDTVVIDVGISSEIQVNDLVIIDGIPLGRIAEVFSATAIVELYSTSGVTSDVLIGVGAFPARAVGQGAGMFMAEVPRDSNVSKGDVVVLSRFPSNVFASVEAVLGEASEPFRVVLFKNPISMANLDWLEVVTNQ